MSKPSSEIVDLEDRDPERLNQHLQVNWEEIIGEPQTIRSPECAWSLSQYCFKFARLGIYTCLSVICGPLVACLVGVSYALFHFQYIWCTVPSLRLCKLSCGVTRSFIRAFTHGLLIPIMDALGHVLSQIRIRTVTIPESEPKEDENTILIV